MLRISPSARSHVTKIYLMLYVPALLYLLLVPSCEFTKDTMVENARDGNTAGIVFLTAIGTDPSAVGWEEHVTPLEAAAQAGRADMVLLLLRKGARVNERGDHGETALTIARDYHQTEIVRLLKAAGGHE